MTSKIVVNNIEADAGVSTVIFGSEISASTFNGNIVGTSATFSGNVNVAGVLTYEDVTSVDAIGLSTFQNGIHVTGGSVGIGTDNPAAELEVYGNGRFKDADGSHGIELYPDVAGLGYQRIISYNRTTSAYENLSIGVNDFVVTTGSSTERLRITSNGKIAFGNYTPTYDLDLLRTTSGVGATMRVGATAASGINTASVIINNGGIGNAVLDFKYESAATPRASIYVYRSDQELRFDTAGSEAARFTSTGNLKFPSGQGIDFSAASGSAAGSTSAVLDDYEEGTFTPRISVESQGSDAVIDNTSGTYVKVGQLVHCTFNADLNGIPAGRGTSFAWQWGGLPFTSLAEGSDGSEDYIGSVRISGADHTSTYGVAAEFILRMFDNGTGGRIEVMRVSNGDIVNASLYMKDNTTINGSITYRTS